jgi:hypothetical protein
MTKFPEILIGLGTQSAAHCGLAHAHKNRSHVRFYHVDDFLSDIFLYLIVLFHRRENVAHDLHCALIVLLEILYLGVKELPVDLKRQGVGKRLKKLLFCFAQLLLVHLSRFFQETQT